MNVKKNQSIVGELSSSSKKMRIVFIIVVSIILVIIGLILKNFERKDLNESTSDPVQIEDNNDKTISIPLQIMRVDVLTNSEKKDIKSVYLLATIKLEVDLDDSEFKIIDANIKDINVDYGGPGNVKIIHPKHVARDRSTTFFYTPVSDPISISDISDEGKNIVYKVVDQYSPISSAYDELGPKGGFLEFRVGIQDIGNYADNDNIKKDGKTNSLKLIKAKPEDIDGSISFKLELKLDNNKTWIKKFVGEWKGKDLIEKNQHTYQLKIE